MTRRSSEDRAAHSAPTSPRIVNKALNPDEGAHTGGQSIPSTAITNRTFHPDASLVLVGIRGSGKRSLGLIAATALGRRFITEDHFFQTVTGLSREAYLRNHGSEQFHKTDVDITRRMLDENKYHCVIDCGLGSLTSSLQDYLRQYCLTNPVVYVHRDLAHVKALLKLDDRSARLLEVGGPSHRKCSNFEYFNLQDDESSSLEDDAADRSSPVYSFKLRKVQEDFSHFVRLITGAQTNSSSLFAIDVPLEARPYTHALELPLSSFATGLDLSALQAAGDIVDIIIDNWSHATMRNLSKLVASVRRHIRTPVCLSIRIPNVSAEIRLSIMNQALRLGPEYVSVKLDTQAPAVLAMKGHTKTIGTIRRTEVTQLGWKDPTLWGQIRKASLTQVDYLRLMIPASSREDFVDLNWLQQEIASKLQIQLPIIAFNTGELGRTSQILNPVLTSVTHPSLQLSNSTSLTSAPVLASAQILRALGGISMLDALQFCIVGGNVSESLSPAMHNAAYAAVGLLHSYTTRNVASWDEVETLGKNTHFGGASVVQPYKVKAVATLSSLSHHAKAIGAVNTLLPLRTCVDGKLLPLKDQAYNRNRAGHVAGFYGDNTDFVGIKTCLSRSLSPRNVIQPKTTGLVIGAGGMARAAVYAMLQLGCRNVCIYNRTAANARSVANHFNDLIAQSTRGTVSSSNVSIHVLESLVESWPSGLSMPTMIVSCVTHEALEGNPGAEFEVPTDWLQSQSGGVVVEMAYMTKQTALTKQIMQYRSSTSLPWVIVSGVDTLIEQAVAQFEIMVGRRAPRLAMTEAVKAAMSRNRQYMMDWGSYRT